MTPRRNLLVSVAGAAAAGTVLPAAHPDAALIAACEAHPARLHAYDASMEDDGPLYDAMMETCRLIRDAKAQTMAGILAKARAAKAEAMVGPGGQEQVDFTTDASAWAWDVMNDLLRLAGET